MTSQNIPLTFAVTDPSLADSLSRSLRLVNTVQVQDEVLVTVDLSHYYAVHQTWNAAPPPQLFVNGVLQTSGYTVDALNGAVTFTLPQLQDAIVSCSYWCSLWSAADLSSFCVDGFLNIEGRIGNGLDDTALPRSLREPIVMMGHILALRSLLVSNLENYRWQVDGKTIDKRTIAQRFRETIAQYENNLRDTLAWLRPQFLAEGATVSLNIDTGYPPTPTSRWPLEEEGGVPFP